jgi:hypothetical protein
MSNTLDTDFRHGLIDLPLTSCIGRQASDDALTNS